MVDQNAIGFRIQNGQLNRISGSKRDLESGGSVRLDHNQASYFDFRVISDMGL